MRDIELQEKACFCINFRQTANTLTKLYNKALEPYNISASQFSLLNEIDYLKECSKTELAYFAKLDRTTVVRNLKILVDKGFVSDRQGENQRESLIMTTDLGKQIVKDGLAAWKKAQDQVKNQIGRENIPLLKQIFRSINELSEND